MRVILAMRLSDLIVLGCKTAQRDDGHETEKEANAQHGAMKNSGFYVLGHLDHFMQLWFIYATPPCPRGLERNYTLRIYACALERPRLIVAKPSVA